MLRAAIATIILMSWAACQDPPVGLSEVERFVTGVHPNSVAVGDFDGDGVGDAVIPGLVTPPLATLWGSSRGPIAYTLSSPLEVGAVHAAAADLDGDGVEELLLSNIAWPAIQVLSGADRRWTVTGQIDIPLAEMMAAGDLDGDGDVDLVVTRFDDDDVVIVTSEDGALVASAPVLLDEGSSPQAVAIGPGPVVAVGEAHGNALSFLGPGDGGWTVSSRSSTPSWPSSLGYRDLDGDDSPEVLGAGNLGDAVFVVGTGPVRTTPAGSGSFGVVVIDDRVFVSNKFEDTLMTFRHLEGELVLESVLATAAGPSALAAIDLDGDGRDELVQVNSFDDSASVFRPR